MKLKFILIIVGILLILPIGFSGSITKFQPGNLSAVNISFPSGGGSNSTYYFQVPNYVYFTSATMNISGFPSNITFISSQSAWDDTEDSHNCTLTSICYQAYDENWSSGAGTVYDDSYQSIYENYTLPYSNNSKICGINVTFKKRQSGGGRFRFYLFNYNISDWDQVYTNNQYAATGTNFTFQYSFENDSDFKIKYIKEGYPLQYKWGVDTLSNFGVYLEIYETEIAWFNCSNISPSNVTLDISKDGDVEFNSTGTFNTTNTTSDFASEINDWLLNNCTSSTCNIFINVSSDSAGNVTLSTLNATYSSSIIDNCSAYNNTILNFTLKDEEDPTTTLNGNIEIVIETPTYNYTFSGENVTNYSLCLAPSQSSVNITKAMIEYSSEGYESSNYSVRNYYLYDATLYSNSTQDIGLYLLKDTVGENVLFHTTDSAGANYPNVYGKIQRYYVGENVYRTVAMIYTDDQGEALTNLDLLDTWYKFILEKDGTVLKNTNPTKITSDEYYFKIYTTTNAFENYLSALNLSYTFTYNSTTNITKLEYNSASGLVRSVCLDIENVKLSGRTSIYSHCENSTSATIFYDLTNDTESGKYFAYASVINNNGNKQTLDVIEITRGSSESQNTFGTEGVALTAFGAGTAMFIGIANPIAPIVLGLLTMVGLVKFGFFNLGTATLVSLSTAGGILIYYLRRK